jgi:hypothetical protein
MGLIQAISRHWLVDEGSRPENRDCVHTRLLDYFDLRIAIWWP